MTLSLQTPVAPAIQPKSKLPNVNPQDITAQQGPQFSFLSCAADVAVYGGSAGSGKSFALLMEAARNIRNPQYSAVLFRRTHPELIAPGGLWPESMNIYPHFGGVPNSTELTWRFPSGAVVKLGHLQYEWDVRKWLGSQIAMIGFDQLEVFSQSQFWYMFSRNRSVCGIRPYMRATANPEPGWLADLLSWWIDQSTGYPIPERSGVLRWFVRKGNDIIWGDSKEQLLQDYPSTPEAPTLPKSLTFIPAKLTDNPILMKADPGYAANLEALPNIERKRLKDGNWKISGADNEWPAEYFERIMFDDWPADLATMTRIMALDPSKGKGDATGDYSAWISLAIDLETMICWFDCDMDNTRPVEPLASMPGMHSIVTDGIEIYKTFRPVAVLVETNQFQYMVATALERWARQLGLVMPISTIDHTEPKAQRIVTTWNPLLAQRRVRIKNTPGGRMLVQQLRDFRRDQKPSSGIHDDGPDAGATAVEMGNEVIFGGLEDSRIHLLET